MLRGRAVCRGMRVTGETVETVRHQVAACLRLLEHYEWLINSFVLDYFQDAHWSRLPSSWQAVLGRASPGELADWLQPGTDTATREHREPWPLSLLALKQTLSHLGLERRPVSDLGCAAEFLHLPAADTAWQFEPELLSERGGQHQSLKHVFRKHVKPKKQYEMCRLAKLISSVAESSEVEKVLDIGSGVGHLSRYLCYNNNLTVACVDGDDKLTVSARKFDEELEKTVEKLKARSGQEDLQLPPSPVHVTSHIAPDMDLASFHQLLRNNFKMKGESLLYGLVGLHTCGDLAPVILKMFVQDSSSRMLTSLGCCYMKIKQHFPMSRYVSSLPWSSLTYTSTELSCHAIEMYADKLRQGEEDRLKVHCYRALLEQMLAGRGPQYRHTILRTVSKPHTLSFPDYVARATAGLVSQGMPAFTEQELNCEAVSLKLKQWWQVVTFYSVRLAFAPVIGKTSHHSNINIIIFPFISETVILLDRCLYLYENGLDNTIFPLFDPMKSPRNQVIMAVKTI